MRIALNNFDSFSFACKRWLMSYRQGSISFMPSDANQAQQQPVDNGSSVNAIETLLAYDGNFDDVESAVSLGYLSAPAEDSTPTNKLEDHNAWQTGAKDDIEIMKR